MTPQTIVVSNPPLENESENAPQEMAEAIAEAVAETAETVAEAVAEAVADNQTPPPPQPTTTDAEVLTRLSALETLANQTQAGLESLTEMVTEEIEPESETTELLIEPITTDNEPLAETKSNWLARMFLGE